MPNHSDWELADIHAEEYSKLRSVNAELERTADELRQQKRQLAAEFDDMMQQRDQSNQLLFEAGKRAGELSKENEELRQISRNSSTFAEENAKLRAALATLREENEQRLKQNVDTIMTLDQMRAEGGLIVYALDTALQLIEQLFIFLPAGTVLPEGVATCKHNLDDAMRALRGPHAVSRQEPFFAPPIAAGNEEVGETEGLRSGLKIAGENIVKLTEQRSKLAEVLHSALYLVETMMNEMRLRGVIPDPIVVGAKASLDAKMRDLLGK